MPTYDYECQSCGAASEVFQRMTDEPLTTCDECGGELRRKIGAGAAVLFRGSGFYATDYKGKTVVAKGWSKPRKDTPAPEPMVGPP